MSAFSKMVLRMAVVLCILPGALAGCKASGKESPAAAGQPPFMSAVASAPPQTPDDALPSEKTGGFDGKRAFAHVATGLFGRERIIRSLRSEEHTSELQSHLNLVCRLL